MHRQKLVLNSADQAEEEIWRTFGVKVKISGHNRTGYRMLLDGVHAHGMSVTDAFNRWGERDESERRGAYVNIKIAERGRFELFGDADRYTLTNGMGLVCRSESIASYHAGEAAHVKTVLIANEVFDAVLADHLGRDHPKDWTAPLVFRCESRVGAIVRAAMFVVDENFDTSDLSIYSDTSLKLTRDALIVAVGEHLALGRSTPAAEPPQAGSRALAFDALDLVRTQERPLSIHDIATALGVGVRTLQIAFRKHVGASPAYVLRMGRLDGAHRDLQSGRAATAYDAAREWGFSNAGRFAAEYRDRIGEYPSETIRRRIFG